MIDDECSLKLETDDTNDDKSIKTAQIGRYDLKLDS